MSATGESGSRPSVRLAAAVYRASLLLYPRDFRRRFGPQARTDFATLATATRRRGRVALLTLLLRALVDTLRTAPREHWETRQAPASGRLGEGARAAVAGLSRDVRFAFRQLGRAPGFAALAIVTVALGVGANTALFSVVHGVLLERLPYPAGERLMSLSHRDLGSGDGGGAVTPGNFSDWREQSTRFVEMAAYLQRTVTLTGRGEAQPVVAIASIGGLFEVLGTPARVGRVFTAADAEPGGPQVAVVSHALWQRLGGDTRLLGDSLRLGGQPYTVLGVMPPEFRFPDADVDLWVPAPFDAEFRRNRTEYFLQVIGRLVPGATLASAQGEMDRIGADLRREFPRDNEDVGVAVEPFRQAMVAGVEDRLLVLMGAVAFVLLVACANLAHMLMARASARREEMALRLSLGASRAGLLRQVLTESVFLAVLGGLAGTGLGWVFLRLLLRFLPGDVPWLQTVGIDLPVLAFTALATFVAGLAFGCFPAFQVTAEAAAAELSRGGRSTRRRGLTEAALVVAEVAFSVMLVAGALLLLRSFLALGQVDPGVRAEGVLTFGLSRGPVEDDAAEAGRVDNAAYMAEVASRLEAVPGVVAAGFVSSLPTAGYGSGAWLDVMGAPLPDGRQPPVVNYRVVTPGYFRAMGYRLARGRWLEERDGLAASPGVLINEALAREVFAAVEPLGQRLTLGPDGGWIPPSAVVGVLRDVHDVALSSPPQPVVYLPHGLVPHWGRLQAAVRVDGDPLALAPTVRRLIHERDPAALVLDVETMDDVVARDLAPTRSTALLVGVFAAVALVMAGVGVFGILSLSVARRVRELGIRLALGADAAALRWAVVRDSFLQALLGAALGLLGAGAVGRALASLLFAVEPDDAVALAAAALLLPVVAAIAAYLPGRRATRIDPAVILRNE